MQINDEMVEKAAAGYWNRVCSGGTAKWPDDVSRDVQDIFREGCRAALEAALSTAEPVGGVFIKADALAETTVSWVQQVDFTEDALDARWFGAAPLSEKDLDTRAEEYAAEVDGREGRYDADVKQAFIDGFQAALSASSVAVKPLEWEETEFLDEPNKGRGAKATSPHSAWYFVNPHKGGWRIHFGTEEIHPTIEAAKAAAQADYEALIRSALSAQVQDVAGLERLRDVTYAVQHNPNCPAKYLVRLVGKSGRIDLKPYGNHFPSVKHETGDVLGFGKTLDEAIDNAIAAAAPAKQEG